MWASAPTIADAVLCVFWEKVQNRNKCAMLYPSNKRSQPMNYTTFEQMETSPLVRQKDESAQQ